MAENVRAIRHAEPQLADLARIAHGNEQLLLGLADGAFEGRLAGIDLAAGAVHLARAMAALFLDEKDLAAAHDEHQGRLNLAPPFRPII